MGRRLEKWKNQKKNRDYQNNQKSPGEQKKLAVAQILINYHLLTLIWKTQKQWKKKKEKKKKEKKKKKWKKNKEKRTKKKKLAKLLTLLPRLTTEWNWNNVKRRISTSTLLENWKKLWNMKVTIVPIVIGAFGTVTKGLLKDLEDLKAGGRVEIIQTTALLKTPRILRRGLETWGDLLSLTLQLKTIN